MNTSRFIALGAVAGGVGIVATWCRGADDAVAFPHVIAIEVGAAEFAPGDFITIESVRGDRPHFENGGRYVVEGSYTLASAETARVSWFITSRGPSGPTPVAPEETATITRGSGRFRLIKTFRADGWPHVSFYVNGQSAGGVYFGEAGVDSTVLRRKTWVRSSVAPTVPPPSASSPSENPATHAAVPPAAATSADANAAILAYLGRPVPAPANLDARYAPDALVAAFRAYSAGAGLNVQRLAVDDSEFPFLVYGLVAGRQGLPDLKSALSKGSDYAYGGSVVGTTGAGATFFAVNLVPASRYPAGTAEAVNRRLLVRLQMLATRAQQ